VGKGSPDRIYALVYEPTQEEDNSWEEVFGHKFKAFIFADSCLSYFVEKNISLSFLNAESCILCPIITCL
jgi:hypothetical protein